jgi:hypothetical protein
MTTNNNQNNQQFSNNSSDSQDRQKDVIRQAANSGDSDAADQMLRSLWNSTRGQ